jgi:hypothetical protein
MFATKLNNFTFPNDTRVKTTLLRVRRVTTSDILRFTPLQSPNNFARHCHWASGSFVFLNIILYMIAHS